MSKQYAVPLSPRGLSSIAPPPPWHYSGDFLIVEFWADPAAVAATLPAGLSVDPSSPGHATALFVDWQFTGENDELLDPARYQYREFFLLVDALYEGQPVAYCPYIFVDNDPAMMRGLIQGFPKRLGAVHQTRTFAAPSLAAAQVAPGARFAATASTAGQRIARAEVKLTGKVDDPSRLSLAGRPIVNLRHFPRLAAGQHETPAVHELVMSIMDDPRMADVWAGEGQLSLPVAEGEEISDLAPVRVGAGYRLSMSYTVTDLKTLVDGTQAA
ncbi:MULTISPECIES: acetoacetate decarboxylase family protein [Paraburkholderia]|uniref:Acetoacetate decarboxylase n=1 Tax=Paraburkholderia largidicola TaxID=3014751 RepID=A0A7I8BR81_9BURK|nr:MULTISPECIES: acetoacetate decarboxylase family protein [Paraburkholderia]BCF91005.1 acetoacetate decarboxylase [Paraburkholderia sp. PGU16]BEU24803.1 acetoacetate decarboxylase family protein [Paraburkholderia sp. 22B1P]CAG9270014.1 Acetoacetate decarboxylase [Paraburkholderia caribensis]